jgi:hypothetical protein
LEVPAQGGVRDSGLSGEPAQRFPTRTSTHKLPIRDEPAKPITNRLDRGHGGIVRALA